MSAEEIIERLKEVCKTKWIRWDIHDCSICSCPVGFIFDKGEAFFDDSCACSPIHNDPQPRDWDYVLDFVSRNIGTNIVQDLINYITEG